MTHSTAARLLLLLIATTALSLAPSGAVEECARAEWTPSIVDGNVVDVDSYVSSTAVLLDSLGRPHVVYPSGPRGIDGWKFESASSTPSGWHARTLPSDGASPRPSVAMDSNDALHLCWRSGVFFGEGILRYATTAGGAWHEETVDGELGSTDSCSIALDAEGRPHIFYTPELFGRFVRYAHWDGAVWIIENVVQLSGVLSPTLALDSAGEPHAVYGKAGGTEVEYAFRSGGAWSFETIDLIPGGQALETALALDSSDRPHVAYDEHLAVGIRYATRTPSGWVTKLVDTGERWDPSIALDADGAPHIVYYDAAGGALLYATRGAGDWCRQVIEDNRSDLIRIGRDASLAIDGESRVHVAYYFHRSGSYCQVKYAVATPP
jgi:hypothetical protein